MYSSKSERIKERLKCTRSVSNPEDSYFGFHFHDFYEIYLFLSGGVDYFIDKTVYQLSRGDMLIISSSEIHGPVFIDNTEYDRYSLHFDPSLAGVFSESHDLLECFTARQAGEDNRIRLGYADFESITSLLDEIRAHLADPAYGSDILAAASLASILVNVSRLYQNRSAGTLPLRLNPLISDIIYFISDNLHSDLSLAKLESVFHINRYHLERLFKKHTGSRLSEYIAFKRLSAAKQLLSSGASASLASESSGFRDYSNFFRMFKKAVGISPTEYRKLRTGK